MLNVNFSGNCRGSDLIKRGWRDLLRDSWNSSATIQLFNDLTILTFTILIYHDCVHMKTPICMCNKSIGVFGFVQNVRCSLELFLCCASRWKK